MRAVVNQNQKLKTSNSVDRDSVNTLSFQGKSRYDSTYTHRENQVLTKTMLPIIKGMQSTTSNLLNNKTMHSLKKMQNSYETPMKSNFDISERGLQTNYGSEIQIQVNPMQEMEDFMNFGKKKVKLTQSSFNIDPKIKSIMKPILKQSQTKKVVQPLKSPSDTTLRPENNSVLTNMAETNKNKFHN